MGEIRKKKIILAFLIILISLFSIYSNVSFSLGDSYKEFNGNNNNKIDNLKSSQVPGKKVIIRDFSVPIETVINIDIYLNWTIINCNNCHYEIFQSYNKSYQEGFILNSGKIKSNIEMAPSKVVNDKVGTFFITIIIIQSDSVILNDTVVLIVSDLNLNSPLPYFIIGFGSVIASYIAYTVFFEENRNKKRKNGRKISIKRDLTSENFIDESEYNLFELKCNVKALIFYDNSKEKLLNNRLFYKDASDYEDKPFLDSIFHFYNNSKSDYFAIEFNEKIYYAHKFEFLSSIEMILISETDLKSQLIHIIEEKIIEFVNSNSIDYNFIYFNAKHVSDLFSKFMDFKYSNYYKFSIYYKLNQIKKDPKYSIILERIENEILSSDQILDEIDKASIEEIKEMLDYLDSFNENDFIEEDD